jgi:hypothetical protein
MSILPKGKYQEAGRLLKVLKAAKPRGVTWEPYLEDLLGFRRLGTEQAMPQKAKNGIGRATEKSGRSKRDFSLASLTQRRMAATLPNFAARKGGPPAVLGPIQQGGNSPWASDQSATRQTPPMSGGRGSPMLRVLVSRRRAVVERRTASRQNHFCRMPRSGTQFAPRGSPGSGPPRAKIRGFSRSGRSQIRNI